MQGHFIQPGDRFTRLTVLRLDPSKKRRYWICRCDCGTELSVRADSLPDRNTQSCGCLKIDSATRHGHSHSRPGKPPSATYNSWQALRTRCTDPTNHNYPRYGGKGITLCQRWRTFENFLADMGERPDGKSIERIDNDGGYWCGHCWECVMNDRPANCRWATPKEQSRNRHNTRFLTLDGERLSLSEWAERIGIPRSVLADRFRKGWDDQRILTTPYKQPPPRAVKRA